MDKLEEFLGTLLRYPDVGEAKPRCVERRDKEVLLLVCSDEKQSLVCENQGPLVFLFETQLCKSRFVPAQG